MTMAGLGGGNKCSNIFEAFQDCQKVTAFKGGPKCDYSIAC